MLVARAGLSPDMVGRDVELASLHRLAALAADQQEPTVALVSAEAGVGKTRLLRELQATAAPGTIVLAGQADERGLHRPFFLVREALQEAVQEWGEFPPALTRFAHPLAHLLSPLLPLSDHPSDGHGHGADELMRAGVSLVRHLTGGGPAILAFDDLHWADAESIEFFRRLSTARGLPALVVGAFRPEEYRPDHPLARTLDALSRQQDLKELTLGCLTRLELRTFLTTVHGGPVADGVVDALHDRTQGNPFFVEELLEAAVKQARDPAAVWTDPEALATASLPWTAAEAVRHRLESRTAEDRRVVQVAAVLGRHFPFDLLAQVLGMREDKLLDACRRLVSAGILAERVPDGFTFRHALTREAISAELLSLDRRRIHDQALEALESSGESCYTRLARHALGADDPGRSRKYVRSAAEEVMREGAPRQALHFTSLGLAVDPDDLRLHAVAARAAADIGRLEDAVEHAARWAALAQGQEDYAEQCRAHCLQAWLQWSAGDLAGTWTRVEAATGAATASGDDAVVARALSVKAQMHSIVGEASQAVDWADRAIEVAQRAGARDVRAHALVTKGTSLADLLADEAEREVVAEARQLLEEGRREAQAIGHVETLTRALHNMLVLAQGLETTAEDRRILDEARDVADRFGQERFASKLAGFEANIALLDGCRVGVEAALAEGKQWILAPMDRVWWATIEATLLLEAGDVDGARQALEDYWPAVANIEDKQAHIDFAAAEAALAAATGDDRLALTALQRAGEAVGRVSLLAESIWWEVAILALEAGLDPALVERAVEATSPSRVRRYAGLTHHFDAALHTAVGRHAEAIRSLRCALQEPQGFRSAFMVADAHLRLARLLTSGGDRDEAKQVAQAAVDLLAYWPGPRLEGAERLVRELDGRQGQSGLLTPREREVLELVARGYSNREIANALFITQKTAATHVSNILSKTGLKSRTQAATWAVSEGLVHIARPGKASA